jgi:SRSO17 transposase
VPEATSFASKPEIALDQIGAARAAVVSPGVVLMDAGYGSDTRLRTEIAALGLCYIAGIQPHATVWPPGVAPLPAKPWSGRGRPTSRTRRDREHQPVQAKALALSLPQEAWQVVTWREGSADWLTSHFCQGTGARRPPRRSLGRTARRRMAADRMAAGREGADQPSRRHLLRAAGRSALDITRGADGAASTITPPCVSPPTAS